MTTNTTDKKTDALRKQFEKAWRKSRLIDEPTIVETEAAFKGFRLALSQQAAQERDARDDERERIACFLEASGHHDIAAQVFAGMTRPIDKDKRGAAVRAAIAHKGAQGDKA